MQTKTANQTVTTLAAAIIETNNAAAAVIEAAKGKDDAKMLAASQAMVEAHNKYIALRFAK
jgi:hypothetical protein